MNNQFIYPFVSIIMNCHNSERYLREAIDSIYAQTYINWEIIFWDNQSTDASAEIANTYDTRLKYYHADEFLSLGAARNKALEHATGEWIGFLDCDDLWTEDKLALQISEINKAENKDVGFIYSNFYRFYEKDKKKELALKKSQPSGDIFALSLKGYNIGMLTVLLKKEELFSLSEKFDLNLNIAEERDLFMRILWNTKALYIDKPLATYRIHDKMTSIKLKDSGPAEVDYVLNKLKSLDMSNIYCTEFIAAFKANNRLKAELFIQNGDSVKAREIMKSFKNERVENRIIYLITYLHPVVAAIVHKALRNLYFKYRG